MNFSSMAKRTLNIVSPAAGAAVTAAQSNSGFGEGTDSEPAPIDFTSIIGSIIFFVAIYLAFKCKAPGGGIDLIQILLACCCSPCYVVYRLAVPCS